MSEQGLNVGCAVLWYHLVCGWYRGCLTVVRNVKLTLLYSGHPAANRLFILAHLAMYSELHLPVGYIIALSESHSSCQGFIRSAR